MHPILLKLGPVTVYAYGVAMVTAFVTATWLASRAARQHPSQAAIGAEPLVDFLSVSLLGGILGGRLLYVALDWSVFRDAPWEALALWHGGLIWYGGLFGGLAASWLYTRAKRLPWLRVMDQLIPFIALGHAIGRIGCFFNGCCYGRPTTAWCGVLLPGHPTPVMPTQLMESAGLVVLFVVLRALQEPAVLRMPGRLFGGYLIGYGLLRFGVEFLRGDQLPWWGGLTLPQGISLGLILAGLWCVRRRPAA